jgi:hypothetical protein
MYVCAMYVRMLYLCMCVCMYVRTYVYMHVCMYLCIHESTDAYMYIRNYPHQDQTHDTFFRCADISKFLFAGRATIHAVSPCVLPRRPGFPSRTVHVRLVADAVALRQVLSQSPSDSPVDIITRCSVFTSALSGSRTKGPFEAQFHMRKYYTSVCLYACMCV